ncbi:hypothetical protein PCAR4_860042 [Paraburkholderia caribensis]|nr:hypothetical protein PCAR4_860042 [Paraburkholderia caribensis]
MRLREFRNRCNRWRAGRSLTVAPRDCSQNTFEPYKKTGKIASFVSNLVPNIPDLYEDLKITVDLLSKCPYKGRAGFQAASELVLS